MSPVTGEVADIVLGPRRVVEQVIINVEKDDLVKIHEPKELKKDREYLKKILINGGMWPLIKSMRFGESANPDEKPAAIYVNIDNEEPFVPQSAVYLKEYANYFKEGLSAIKLLAEGNLVVSAQQTKLDDSIEFSNDITHVVSGDYPASNPVVLMTQLRESSDDNNAWMINGMDVCRIGMFILNGTYPFEKIITVAGGQVDNPSHFKTREGVVIEDIIQAKENGKDSKFILGGLLTGREAKSTDGISFFDYAINVVENGREPEMFNFFKPGFDKLSYFNVYFGKFFSNKKWNLESNLNGGHRACIACGECPNVCPTGLYPQFIMKELFANDIEQALDMGLLDCAECGLCSFICPSKIELKTIFEDAKFKVYEEMQSE